jgi:hypothetical protein
VTLRRATRMAVDIPVVARSAYFASSKGSRYPSRENVKNGA